MRKKNYQKAFNIIVEIEEKTNNSQFVYLNRFANEAEKDKAFEYVIKSYEHILNKKKGALKISIK